MLFTRLGILVAPFMMMFGFVSLYNVLVGDGWMIAHYFGEKSEWLYVAFFLGLGLVVGILAEMSAVVHRTPSD